MKLNKEIQSANEGSNKGWDGYFELFNHAPNGYLCLNLDGAIIEINDTAAKLLGNSREQLLGMTFLQFIDEEYKERWCHHCLHTSRQDKKKCEVRLIRADKAEFYAHLDCLIIDQEGLDSQLRINLTDITERKLAEDALRIAAVAFETQIGILVANQDKVIQKVNPAFTRLTGYAAEEIIGQTPSILRSEVHDDSFYRAMWADIVRNDSWQGEVWDVRRDGLPFPVWLTITAIKDGQGNVINYVGSFTDLTPQKKKQKQLLDDRQSLESQIVTAHEKVQQISKESLYTKVALDVLLKQLESTIVDAQSRLSLEMEKTVLPFLKKIRKISHDQNQIQLLDVLESNLEYLIQSYGRATSLNSVLQKLTPTEIQVATMVRQGFPTKTIASSLNMSSGTVNIHRKNIRKKLGLDKKATNLCSYLLSMPEDDAKND